LHGESNNMKATLNNMPEAKRKAFDNYCAKSGEGDRIKASNIHNALCIQLDVFEIDALKGQKASALGIGINEDACRMVWQSRKASGVVEEFQPLRTYVSRVWKYDVAPHIKETDDQFILDWDKIKATNAGLAEGKKGFSTGRYNDSVGNGSGGGGATSKPQALITWYKGLKDDKKADFVASPEYATILSWK